MNIAIVARKSLLFLILALVAAPASAIGVLYTDLVIVGDSLSETGNYSTLISPFEFPSAPYADGRFSNGPVWVENLSAQLGLGPVMASESGGNNYAWGAAQTGGQAGPPALVFDPFPIPVLTPIDLGVQTDRYLADVSGAADPNALYVVWGGGNDAFAGNVDESANNIFGIIDDLHGAGARNFLVPNLPENDAISVLFGDFNDDLAVVLDTAEATLPGLQLTRLDVNQLFIDIVADAFFNQGGLFGITNFTDSCLNGLTPCADPDAYLFWDPIPHPTARAHELIADAAYAALVPLPAAFWLMAAALGALGTVRRRRA